jgi:DNA repair protein RecO (recombination protein O)
LERLATSLYLMELADALLPDASPHPGAYTLLLNALRALNEGQPVGGVARYTELRLLEDSGYLPELGNCQVCGAEITPGHHKFAPGLGGVVDDTCDVPIGQLMLLSLNALKILRHYRRSPMAEAVRVGLSPVLHEELERILGVSIHYVLEREMASSDFIDHLKQVGNRTMNSLRPKAL